MVNERNSYLAFTAPSTSAVEQPRYIRNQTSAMTNNNGRYEGAIPRVKTNNARSAHTSASGTYASVQPRNKLNRDGFDTFGENAIETIYDEFRFLDEPDSPSSCSIHPIIPTPIVSCQPPSPTEESNRLCSAPLLAYCLLPVCEALCSLFVIAVATLRLTRIHLARSVRVTNEGNESSGLIFDVNVTELASALSVYPPAICQLFAAAFGFWPFARSKRRSMQFVHIVLCCFTIFLAFPSIFSFVEEIQLSRIDGKQQIPWSLCLACFETVLLPTTTLVISAFYMAPSRKIIKTNFIVIIITLCTFILSIAFLATTAIYFSRSLKDSSDVVVLHGGMEELIRGSFLVLASCVFVLSTCVRTSGLHYANVALIIVCLATSVVLLSPTRLTELVLSLKQLEALHVELAIRTNVLLIYVLLLALVLSLVLQLVSTVCCITPQPTPPRTCLSTDTQRTSF